MPNQTETTISLQNSHELPSALKHLPEILGSNKPAIFLDYDGCLTPIVSRPEDAVLSHSMRESLLKLANTSSVAIVSGRDREDVYNLVKLKNLYFAGSHGFDISGPDNMHIEPGGAKNALPALDKADKLLKEKLMHLKGAMVERKKYAIAVHYRNVAGNQQEDVKTITEEVLKLYPQLKIGRGKKIIELKPNLDWHKGKAVLWLLENLDLNKPGILPIYIGDDITDEDAFAALQGKGIGILVGEHEEQTAATYRLENVDEVQNFLDELSRILSK
jgi:trehalose-phosphatase